MQLILSHSRVARRLALSMVAFAYDGGVSRLLILLPVVMVLSAVSSAGAAEKGFWGPSEVNGVSQFPIYRELGVTLYQTQLRWQTIAPTRPENPTDPDDPAYKWPAEMDQIIKRAKASKIKVLFMLIGSPPWANGGKSSEWSPSPKAYAQFARAASRRYPAVRRWMIWGEPSRSANFKPLVPQKIGRRLTRAQAAAPRRYARLLDAAYGALKRVRRSNVVIGGNTFTAGDIRPAKWVNAMRLPNGKRPRLDVYGHNPFCLRAPSLNNPPGPEEIVDFSDLRRFQRVVDSAFGRRRAEARRITSRRVPLFLSEWTVPTGPDREFNFFATPAAQARFITRGFRIAKTLKVYGLGWIHLYDEPVPADGGRRSQGGLIDADGRRKPGFARFRRGRL